MNSADKILNSLEGIKKAEAPPQFYADIRAKMARQEKDVQHVFFGWKPAFATVILFIFLVINITVLSFSRSKIKASSPTGINAFAAEYNLTSDSFLQ